MHHRTGHARVPNNRSRNLKTTQGSGIHYNKLPPLPGSNGEGSGIPYNKVRSPARTGRASAGGRTRFAAQAPRLHPGAGEAQVALAAIGQDRDHRVTRSEAPSGLDRAKHVRAGGDAHEQALLAPDA